MMKIGPFEITLARRDSSENAPEKKSQDFWTQEDVDAAIMPRTAYNYGRDVKRGLESNVIMAPVGWIMRTFTEAVPVVQRKQGDRWKRADGHQAERLIASPNEFYDDDTMLKALVISYCLDGNAYLIKRRNRIGEVLELWYVPHWMIEPKWPKDGETFISHYEYRTGDGQKFDLLPRDVVHFRFGLDPRNVRRGFSPLRPLLREVFTDEEASNFAAAVLRNQGFPGVVISPEQEASMTVEDAENLKAKWKQQFTRDSRGEAFVSTLPTKVSTFGFDANQINLTGLRDITEERVCAVFGLPAAVVGFGSGLQQTKVGATMREAVRLARVNVINPMGKTFAKTLTRQLLVDFVVLERGFRMQFDMSDVSVFQEDETEREGRILARVAAGVMTVADAQAELGLEIDDSQEVYLRETKKTAVKKNEDPTENQPTNLGSNGNGGGGRLGTLLGVDASATNGTE